MWYQYSDTIDTSTTANSSDASKTSASVTRLSSYFITFSFFAVEPGNMGRSNKAVLWLNFTLETLVMELGTEYARSA